MRKLILFIFSIPFLLNAQIGYVIHPAKELFKDTVQLNKPFRLIAGASYGKVLTCDSDGLAKWQDATGGGSETWEQTLTNQSSTPFSADHYVDLGNTNFQLTNGQSIWTSSPYTGWWSNQANYNYTYWGDSQFQFLSDNNGAGLIINTDNGNSYAYFPQSDIHLPLEHRLVFNYTDTNWSIFTTNSTGGSLVNNYGLTFQSGAGSGNGFVFRDNTGQVNFEIENSTRNAVFNGNVGIGTTTPQLKLDVVGDAVFSTDGSFNITNADKSLDYFVLDIGQSKALFENVNVGIGTATPSVKLEVNGAVKITDGTQSNGYVLTSDASGNATWDKITATNKFDFSGLPQYANNANALSGGLVAGQIYVDNSYHITVVHP